MTTITRAYPKTNSSETALSVGERTGGSRDDQPQAPSELAGYFTSHTPFGSHMPLDTRMNWDWRNPLNIIPAFMVLLFVLTLIELLFG